ncbi:hypothetical protein U1Q18_001115, partial [Sarracenia purpurea var. burkii]
MQLYSKLLGLEGRGSWVPRLERPCPRPYSATSVTRPLSSTTRIKGGEENGGPRPAVLVAVETLIETLSEIPTAQDSSMTASTGSSDPRWTRDWDRFRFLVGTTSEPWSGLSCLIPGRGLLPRRSASTDL